LRTSVSEKVFLPEVEIDLQKPKRDDRHDNFGLRVFEHPLDLASARGFSVFNSCFQFRHLLFLTSRISLKDSQKPLSTTTAIFFPQRRACFLGFEWARHVLVFGQSKLANSFG